jgi:hypothetical protein
VKKYCFDDGYLKSIRNVDLNAEMVYINILHNIAKPRLHMIGSNDSDWEKCSVSRVQLGFGSEYFRAGYWPSSEVPTSQRKHSGFEANSLPRLIFFKFYVSLPKRYMAIYVREDPDHYQSIRNHRFT